MKTKSKEDKQCRPQPVESGLERRAKRRGPGKLEYRSDGGKLQTRKI